MSSELSGDERQAAAEPAAQLPRSTDGDINHLPDYLRQLQNVMEFNDNSFPLKSRPSDTDAFGCGLFSGEENEGFFGDIDDIPVLVPVSSEHRFKPPPTPKFGPRSPAHPTPDWNFITRHGSKRCPSAGSRCPSLVSGGTASSYCPSLTSESTSTSRNSSTRSAKSLRRMSPGVENLGSFEVEGIGLTLYINGLTKSTGSQKRTSKIAASDATPQTQSVPPGESRITSQDVTDDSNMTSAVEGKDRPRKCPVESCEYHVKGFVRAYDQMRHVGTHNKTQMICGFCPVSANGAEKSFRRYEIFSRHLSSVHGADPLSSAPLLGTDLMSPAEKADRKSRRRELYATGVIQNPTEASEGEIVAACTMCLDFFSPQGMVEHLPGCVLRQVTHRFWDQDSEKSSNSYDNGGTTRLLATPSDVPVSTSPREAMPAQHRKFSGTHVETHGEIGHSSVDTRPVKNSSPPLTVASADARRRNSDIFINPLRNNPRPPLRRRGKQVITATLTEPSLQSHDIKRLSRSQSNVMGLEDCYSATDSESGEERIARLRFGLRSGNHDNRQARTMRSPTQAEAKKLSPNPERERAIISANVHKTEADTIPDTTNPQVARRQVPKRISAVSLAESLISDNPSDSEDEGRKVHKKAVAESVEKYAESVGLDEAKLLRSKSSATPPAKATFPSSCLSPTTSNEVNSCDEETDWTEETSASSPQSDPGSQLHPILSPIKQDLVDQIMREFHRLFDNSLPQRMNGRPNGIRECNGGVVSGDSSQSTSGGKSSVGSSADSYVNRKRSISNRGSPPPNRDGDNDEDPNKRRRPDPKRSGGKDPICPDRRFACPYYKRNPGRHLTFTSCRDPGFNTVARLKEHLYRRHLLPIQCHRCCTIFANEPSLREHQRDPRGCEVQEQIPLEGFDKEQERKLKSKKRNLGLLTEEDKWKGVYRVLFPDDNDDDMPSPYIEYDSHTRSNPHDESSSSDISRFQEFSRLELPRLVRRTLEVVVEQEAQPLEDKLKERLVDIVKECQTQLMTMFHAHGNGLENAGTITKEKTVGSDHETMTVPSLVEYSPQPWYPESDSPQRYPSRETPAPELQLQSQPHSHSNTDQPQAFPWQDTDTLPYTAPLFSLPSTSSESVDVSFTSHTPSTSVSAYTSNKHPTSSPPSQGISSPDSGYDSTCTWTNPWPKAIDMAMEGFEFGFFGDGEDGGGVGFQNLDLEKFVGTEGYAFGGEDGCEGRDRGGNGSQDVDVNWMGKPEWIEEGR